MRDRLLWNRRDFVHLAGCSSLGVMSTRLPWLSAAGKENRGATPRFAYVGYAGISGAETNGSAHGIRMFAIEGERWRPIGAVASDHPSFLTLHPSDRFLYAISEVDRYENLPSGSVEAYAVDAKNGNLTLLNRQPLSLSATAPRHMTVSPDGRVLVVAVHGGGAYNMLPIDEDGRLGRVSGILKETGSGPDEEHQQTAHPQMVMFDRMGRLLGADMGSDRLSVFTLEDGRLTVAARSEARAGSGPRHMELHPSGKLLFVANGLDASVSCYGYDEKNGRILKQVEHVPTVRNSSGKKNAVVMAMHPSGEFLYTAHRCGGDGGGDGITVWRSNSTGALRAVQHEGDGLQSLHAMTMAPDGSSLLALSRKSGSVVCWRIDRRSGRLAEPVQVAKVQAPTSLTVKYL
jgi:6-phosphogluconolactonase (cycloisomerase 2 family)